MIKRAKFLASDLANLQAELKTHAHRRVDITLRPRGNKGRNQQALLLLKFKTISFTFTF
jgi:hypothetical protein